VVDPALEGQLRRRWQLDLGDVVTFPVIAEGRVIVSVSSSSSETSSLVALDADSGAEVWSRPDLWGGVGYADGRVFVTGREKIWRL
jgi:outer membrane protein assembly factor BamB